MIEQINELVKICGKNNIEFILSKDGEFNTAEFFESEKKFELKIPDFEDKNLKSLLENELEELKKFFN